MISVEHLTKRYPARTAVSDVSFEVKKGEVVGFLGPNGAGKSTTLRMITGFLPPTDGRISVGGFDVLEQSVEARRLIGYMPERAGVDEHTTVWEHLDFFARAYGLKGAAREARPAWPVPVARGRAWARGRARLFSARQAL